MAYNDPNSLTYPSGFNSTTVLNPGPIAPRGPAVAPTTVAPVTAVAPKAVGAKSAPAAPAPQTFSFMNESVQVNPVTGKQIGAPTVFSSENAQKNVDAQTQWAQQQEANIAAKSAAAQQNAANPNIGKTGRMDYSTDPNGVFVAVDPTTGQDVKSSTTSTASGVQEDPLVAQYKQTVATSDQEYQNYKSKIDSIQNGTMPLTPAQQASLDAIRQSTDRLKAQQEKINAIEFGNTTMAGVRSGRQRYTSDTEDVNQAELRTKELQRITDIENQGLSLMAQARQAITDKNFEDLNTAYNQFQNNQQTKTNALLKLMDINAKQEETQQKKLDSYAAAQKEKQKMQQDNMKFVVDNGIKSPLFELGGTLYHFDGTNLASVDNLEQYKELGGKDDYSNVQVLAPEMKLAAGVVGEYQYYKQELEKTGATPVSFNEYQNIDANRKARVARAGATVIQDTTKQLDQVKKIISKHPGQWGNAADEIDKIFGQGTAFLYDDLLKAEYAPKKDAVDLMIEKYAAEANANSTSSTIPK